MHFLFLHVISLSRKSRPAGGACHLEWGNAFCDPQAILDLLRPVLRGVFAPNSTAGCNGDGLPDQRSSLSCIASPIRYADRNNRLSQPHVDTAACAAPLYRDV